MVSTAFFREEVSIARIRGHILALEGVRHPVAAPEPRPHYHQPSDTLATLNLELAAKVCRVTADVVLDMGRLTTELLLQSC
jgi:hypothetical protein